MGHLLLYCQAVRSSLSTGGKLLRAPPCASLAGEDVRRQQEQRSHVLCYDIQRRASGAGESGGAVQRDRWQARGVGRGGALRLATQRAPLFLQLSQPQVAEGVGGPGRGLALLVCRIVLSWTRSGRRWQQSLCASWPQSIRRQLVVLCFLCQLACEKEGSTPTVGWQAGICGGVLAHWVCTFEFKLLVLLPLLWLSLFRGSF